MGYRREANNLEREVREKIEKRAEEII